MVILNSNTIKRKLLNLINLNLNMKMKNVIVNFKKVP